MDNGYIYIELDYEICGVDSNEKKVTTNKIRFKKFDNRKLYRLLYYANEFRLCICPCRTPHTDRGVKIPQQVELNKDLEKLIIQTIWINSGFKPLNLTVKEAADIIDKIFNAVPCLKNEYVIVHRNNLAYKWKLFNRLPSFMVEYLNKDKNIVNTIYGRNQADEAFADSLIGPEHTSKCKQQVHYSFDSGAKTKNNNLKAKSNKKHINLNSSKSLPLSERLLFCVSRSVDAIQAAKAKRDEKTRKQRIETIQNNLTNKDSNDVDSPSAAPIPSTNVIIVVGIGLCIAYIFVTDPRFDDIVRFLTTR